MSGKFKSYNSGQVREIFEDAIDKHLPDREAMVRSAHRLLDVVLEEASAQGFTVERSPDQSALTIAHERLVPQSRYIVSFTLGGWFLRKDSDAGAGARLSLDFDGRTKCYLGPDETDGAALVANALLERMLADRNSMPASQPAPSAPQADAPAAKPAPKPRAPRGSKAKS